MIYLLTHLILSSRGVSSARGPASTPWTEYLKFLPRDVPVPTMWSEVERALLQGTSLEVSAFVHTRPYTDFEVAEPQCFRMDMAVDEKIPRKQDKRTLTLL